MPLMLLRGNAYGKRDMMQHCFRGNSNSLNTHMNCQASYLSITYGLPKIASAISSSEYPGYRF